MASPRKFTLAASHGLAVELAEGQSVKIVNTHGSQVVDTWAFAIDESEEYLSMPVTRRLVYRLMGIDTCQRVEVEIRPTGGP